MDLIVSSLLKCPLNWIYSIGHVRTPSSVDQHIQPKAKNMVSVRNWVFSDVYFAVQFIDLAYDPIKMQI